MPARLATTELERLGLCLAALAGYTDAIGFISLKGFFISFMTGNSTRLSVDLAQDRWRAAITGLVIVCLFVIGVAAGSAFGHRWPRSRMAGVLSLVTALLAIGALLAAAGERTEAMAAMVLAMGAENTVFESDRRVSFGLTYQTGTLVRIGQGLAARLAGRPSQKLGRDIGLWVSLTAGAVAGALCLGHMGLAALWVMVAYAGVLALASLHLVASGSVREPADGEGAGGAGSGST